MLASPPILVAGLTGLASGLVLSIPIGPVNLTILNEGARRGFNWAMLIGLGATAMEFIYCFVAFTGFAAFFAKGYVKDAMELFSFAFILYLGIKFLVSKSVLVSPMRMGGAAGRMKARIGAHFHPSSAFFTGMVQVMGNLGVLVWWVILGAYFISRGWVRPDWPGKVACVAGATLGIILWYLALSWIVSLRHGKLSDKTLLRMQQFSGIFLIVVAIINAVTTLLAINKKG